PKFTRPIYKTNTSALRVAVGRRACIFVDIYKRTALTYRIAARLWVRFLAPRDELLVDGPQQFGRRLNSPNSRALNQVTAKSDIELLPPFGCLRLFDALE